MDQQTDKEQQSQRVAELEGELDRLRQELAAQAGDSGGKSAPRAAEGGYATSRTKMVLVGVVIALLVLATITVIFSALSSGFSSFADKAAQVFVPEGANGQPAPAPAEEQEPQTPAAELPRAPGL